MEKNHHYDKKLKGFSRDLRKNGTKSEACLWKFVLSKKQMLAYPFLRQRVIGNCIVDFYCKELKLAIELDGLTHHDDKVVEKDIEKEKFLNELGITVLRFTDNVVLSDIESVRIVIENTICQLIEKKNNHPSV